MSNRIQMLDQVHSYFSRRLTDPESADISDKWNEEHNQQQDDG